MVKRFTGPDSRYSLSIQDRTLDFKIQGIVDMEMALRFMLDFKIKVQHLNQPHWATLMDLSEWGLHPPEIIDFLTEFHEWAQENGQIAEAAVVNDSVLKVMARNRLIETRSKKVHQEYFKTRAAAIEWLQHLSLWPE